VLTGLAERETPEATATQVGPVKKNPGKQAVETVVLVQALAPLAQAVQVLFKV